MAMLKSIIKGSGGKIARPICVQLIFFIIHEYFYDIIFARAVLF